MRRLLTIITLFISISCFSETLLEAQGKVAGAPIEMMVTIDDDGQATGHYLYLKTKIPIELQGKLEGSRLTLLTVNNPKITETFIGDIEVQQRSWPEGNYVSNYQGNWYGVHAVEGELPNGYGFQVANPFADGEVSCEEMEAYPDIVFDQLDLGTGLRSPIKVDYDCPKSLESLEFINLLNSTANLIRSPDYGRTCSGTLIYAQSRYHRFSLTWLGYSPDTFYTYSELEPADSYFEHWSYYSHHNRELFNSYKNQYEEAKLKLQQWFIDRHPEKKDQAEEFTNTTLKLISTWAYGRGGYFNPHWDTMPFTDAAIAGDTEEYIESLAITKDAHKMNSLNRLIYHKAPIEVIRATATAIGDRDPVYSQESPLSLAIYESEIIQVLDDAGFDVNHKNEFGKTPLFYAVEYGQHDAVKLLVELGADVNTSFQENYGKYHYCVPIDNWGKTPLMHAAQHSDIEMVKLLIELGARVDSKDVNDKEALSYASSDVIKNYLLAYSDN